MFMKEEGEKMKKRINNEGFSLVELIIVIAIMAVLVGFLAPQYLKYVHNSKVSMDISNADEIAAAINTAIADNTYQTNAKMPSGDEFPPSRLNSSWTYNVTVDTENGVQLITLNNLEVYPDPKSATGYYTTNHK